jgi:hypothetical protein
VLGWNRRLSRVNHHPFGLHFDKLIVPPDPLRARNAQKRKRVFGPDPSFGRSPPATKEGERQKEWIPLIWRGVCLRAAAMAPGGCCAKLGSFLPGRVGRPGGWPARMERGQGLGRLQPRRVAAWLFSLWVYLNGCPKRGQTPYPALCILPIILTKQGFDPFSDSLSTEKRSEEARRGLLLPANLRQHLLA